MNRSVSVGVVVLVVVVSIAGLGVPVGGVTTGPGESVPDGTQQIAVGTHAQTQSQQSPPTGSVAQSQDFDNTTFEITVHENGSATWTFQHEKRFENGSESDEREAFEEFASEFESEETGLYERFTEQAQTMTENGADRTGREMEATNFQRSATVEEQFGAIGIVEMSFTWEGFATVEDGTVEVGDVFQNIYIAQDQTIVIRAGDGLTFNQIEPEADAQIHPGDSLENADSVRWSGERQFLDGNPRVVLVPNGGPANADGTEGLISWLANGDDTAWQLAIGALIVLGIAGGAVWYRRQRTDADNDGDGTATEAAAQSDGANPAADQNPTAASPGGDYGDSAASESNPLPDEELLTDDDRVVKLIRENGGRMKQVNIVEETGWSKSKVSMLLSDMEEEGTISKLRVGRENIISLEGFEPEATKSPFDE